MFHIIKSSILYASFVVITAISSNASAITICALSCPGGSGSGEPSLPKIVEFASPDGSQLDLDINGLMFLDISLFNNLSGLTISASTPIYNGLSELPSNIVLPEQFELNLVEFSGGSLSLIGGTVEYSILRNFQSDTIMNLSTPDGIIVIDTNSLFAVPLPASLALLLSGLAVLLTYGTRKNNLTICSTRPFIRRFASLHSA